MLQTLPFDIQTLHSAYAAGTSPQQIIDECQRRISQINDPGIFIHRLNTAELELQLETLGQLDFSSKPLWGIPFVIKDNIDTQGSPTTAACPAYTYTADSDAFVVDLLKKSGAILIGKTNLDQFATGLVGVRTPYPHPKNAIDPELVPGGSSSGSATAVAHGIVSFSLGTDTAGSGRVPAALNNIVGLKPTLGALSLSGVVPACKTLDTVSIFALNVEDAYQVFSVANKTDPCDAQARIVPNLPLSSTPPGFKVAVPTVQTRRFFEDRLQAESFQQALDQLVNLGAEIVEIDFTPFYTVAELLYQGAWVAERYTVIESLLKQDPQAIFPVTRQVIEIAENLSSADVFRDIYRLQELKAQLAPLLREHNILCVPSIPTFYSVQDLEKDPIGPNSRLGTYTNFVNLLDMCGITVPCDPRSDGRPGSVTLLSSAGHDADVASMAYQLQQRCQISPGATKWQLPPQIELASCAQADEIALAVVGAHMSGLALNHELTRLRARFLKKDRSADKYRLYSLPGGPPFRPGLVQDPAGSCIQLEVWAMPKTQFGTFMQGIPQPLAIGTLELESGELVKGFLCETAGLEGARDISDFGGWRHYLDSL